MSDAPDESGPIQRRTPRASDGGAPVSGALAIVLAVVAVVAGFLILKSISDDDTSLGTSVAGNGDQSGVSTTIDPLSPAASTLPTTTTVPPLVTTGASVIVANANDQTGTAASMSTALEIAGFDMVDPVDAAAAEPITTSVVYYDPAVATNQAVADSVARAVGGATVSPLDGLPPVAGSSMNGAGVLLMLGLDKANKSLADLNPAAATTVTNPPVVGAEATTTTTIV